jgi:hypothetical protein
MGQVAAQNPVAFLGGGIGDAVLALPTLRALAESFNGRLSLVWQGGYSWEFMFEGLALNKRVRFWYQPTVPDAIATVVASLGECDLFISLVPWKAPGVRDFMRMVRPATSVGFFSDDFKMKLQWDESKHAMNQLFQAAQIFEPTANLEDFANPMSFGSTCMCTAQNVLEQLSSTTYLLAFHNQTDARKMWPREKLNTLLLDFLRDHDEFVALSLGARGEQERNAVAGARVIQCDQVQLETSFCLLSQADLFFGVDSSMLHAADLLRTPGVGVFGPTLASEFGFRLAAGISLQGEASTASIGVRNVRLALERQLALFCNDGKPRRIKNCS